MGKFGLIDQVDEFRQGASISHPRSENTESRNSRILRWAVLPLMLAALAGCRGEELPDAAPTVLGVDALRVETTDHYTVRRVYIGEVKANQVSELGFELNGTILQVTVEEGNVVQAGAPLAVLDTALLETERAKLQAQRNGAIAYYAELRAGPRKEVIAAARASVKELNAVHEEAKRNLERTRQLRSSKTLTQEEYESAVTAVSATVNRLAAASSKLAELLAGTRQEQLDVQRAQVHAIDAARIEFETRVRKSTLRAPFAGTVGRRHVDEGDTVLVGESVVRLVDTSSFEASIDVPITLVDSLRERPQRVLQIGDSEYKVRFHAVLPELDRSTRTIAAVFRLEPGLPLFDGQIARLSIETRVDQQGAWLPISALVKGVRGLWACYSLTRPDDSKLPLGLYRVRRSDLVVLHEEAERVFVRGTISPGNLVVLDGVARLVPHQIVQLQTKSLSQNQETPSPNPSPENGGGEIGLSTKSGSD